MALTMPDICGKISYPNIEHSGPRYKKWFEDNLAETYKTEIGGHEVVFLTASDCWALRCSILHLGTDDITGQRAQDVLDKFMFTTLGSHLIRTDKVLTLNTGSFCEEICCTVDKWYQSNKNDNKVKTYIESVVKIHSEAFNPIPGVRIGWSN